MSDNKSNNKSDNATQIPGLKVEFPGLSNAMKAFSDSLSVDDWRSIVIIWGNNVITGLVDNIEIPEYDSVVVSMEGIEMSSLDDFARAHADLLEEVPTEGDST